MKVEKFKKCFTISIILICIIFGETSAQSPRRNRKKSNGNNLQKIDGFDHSLNDGLSQYNVKQKRPGSGQRRRTKNNQIRQDHGKWMSVSI